jgi:ferredoxin-NADP reductase
MLRYITSKNLPNSVKLFYSSRFCENFLCIREFEEFKERKNNLECILSLTGGVIPENWKGEEGRVDEKMLRSKIGSFDGRVFYICGPPPMVNEMVEVVSRNGVENERIKKEGWG